MSCLLTLHQSLLEPILSDWLHILSLCSLDTAVCNSGLRNYFLSVLSLCRVTNNEDFTYGNDGLYGWSHLRRVSLKGLYLNKTQCRYPSFIPLLTKQLTQMTAPLCSEFVELVEMFNLSFKHLTLTGSEVSFSAILRRLLGRLGAKLEHLIAPNVTLLKSDIDEVVRLCPNLKTFDVSSTEVRHILENCPIELMTEVSLQQIMDIFGLHMSLVDLVASSSSHVDKSVATLTMGKNKYTISKVVSFRVADEEVQFLSPYLSCIKELTVVACDWAKVVTILSHCVHLSSLTVAGDIEDEEMFGLMLKSFPGLKTLKLFLEQEITQDALVIYASLNCPQLETFYLERCRISPDALQKLVTGCPKIIRLQLSQPFDVSLLLHKAISLDSIVLEEVNAYTKTTFAVETAHDFSTKLEYSSSAPFSNAVFLQLFGQNPLLKEIKLDKLSHLDGNIIKDLVSSCPKLQRVTVIDYGSVSFEELCAFNKCPDLQFLCLASPNMKKMSLNKLLRGLKNLKSLHLPSCYDFLKASELKWIVKHCPHIKDVKLGCSHKLDSHHIAKLLEGCPKLNRLSLEGCGRIKSDIFSVLSGRRMREINLRGTSIEECQLIRFIEASNIRDYCEVKTNYEVEEEDEDENWDLFDDSTAEGDLSEDDEESTTT